MARLTNVRQRCICSACGVGMIIEMEPVAGVGWDELTAAKLAELGWRILVGPPWPLLLCKEHAAAYSHATEDEIRALRCKLLAFRVADQFGLEFYLANGRVVTEKDERQATVPELAMWEALRQVLDRRS